MRVIHREPVEIRRIYAAVVQDQRQARESGDGDWIEKANVNERYWSARVKSQDPKPE
jgi:endonuclease YncB( thermonuclease family)